MKKLTGILFIILSLTHCYKASDTKLDCAGLDGAYTTVADMVSNYLPWFRTYNVDIASNMSDIIVKVESASEEGEKNVLCSVFYNVKTEDGSSVGSEYDVLNKVLESNDKKFASAITSLSFGSSILSKISNAIPFVGEEEGEEGEEEEEGEEDSVCSADSIVVSAKDGSSKNEVGLYKSDREAKSYSTIKKECSRLQIVQMEVEAEEAETN